LGVGGVGVTGGAEVEVGTGAAAAIDEDSCGAEEIGDETGDSPAAAGAMAVGVCGASDGTATETGAALVSRTPLLRNLRAAVARGGGMAAGNGEGGAGTTASTSSLG
jgi:hypothetical protein